MEKIGKPWQTHQGMQDFFWCFLKRDSISGLSDAWRMFHRHRNGIAYCEDKFAFETGSCCGCPSYQMATSIGLQQRSFLRFPHSAKGQDIDIYIGTNSQPGQPLPRWHTISSSQVTIQSIQKPSKNPPRTIGCSIWCLFSSDPSDLWRKEWRSSFKAGPRWGPAKKSLMPPRCVRAGELCKKEVLDFIRKYKDIRYLYVLWDDMTMTY